MDQLLVIAAEASADRYTGKILSALKTMKPSCTPWGIGGKDSVEAGLEPVIEASKVAVMGLVEVLGHARTIHRVYREIIHRVEESPPRAALLVDYPAFNFRLMKHLHRLGIPVVYFICPQVWAWKRHRMHDLEHYAARRIVIFPFEVDFYARHGIQVDYYGHPLIEEIPMMDAIPDTGEIRIGMLPGSRKAEIRRHLPLFIESIKRMDPRPDHVRLFPAPTIPPSLYDAYLKSCRKRPEREQDFSGINAALVTSGTATLEMALHGIPSVVAYRMNPLSATILKPFVKVPYASIVNILAEREIFPEFIQSEAGSKAICGALEEILASEEKRAAMREGMMEVRKSLGTGEVFSRVAEVLTEVMA